MYFFYIDESGGRDPSAGTVERPKDHIYVLLAVGMYERHWRPFERSISNLKLELSDYLKRTGKGTFDLSQCEIKSNWLRNHNDASRTSPFLARLHKDDTTRISDLFLSQLEKLKMTVMAVVIDKRELRGHITAESLHTKAYEFLLERIEGFMNEQHQKHQALIVMDHTSPELNKTVAMRHAALQRAGNQNLRFHHIVEYPFFSASELSNGVQLADLLAYNVYRAFRREDFDYLYFQKILPFIHKRQTNATADGLKVWPDQSPLVAMARQSYKRFSERL